MDATANEQRQDVPQPDTGYDGDAYVIKQVPAWVRLAFAVPLFLLVTLIAWGGYEVQVEKGTLLSHGWILAAIWVAGVWCSWKIWKRELRKELATTRELISDRERYGKVAIASALLVLALTVIWGVQYSSNQLTEYWWYAWPMVLIGVGYITSTLRQKQREVLTKAAMVEAGRLKSVSPKPSKWELVLEEVLAIWWLRYALGVLVFLGAYEILISENTRKGDWIGAVGLTLWGMYLMREIFGWVIGAAIVGGIVYLIFGMLAALPVSVAIIIGALIIGRSRK